MSNLSSQIDGEKLREYRSGHKKIFKRTGHVETNNNVTSKHFIIKQDRRFNKVPKKFAAPELKVKAAESQSRFVLTKRNQLLALDQNESENHRRQESPQKIALDIALYSEKEVEECWLISGQ